VRKIVIFTLLFIFVSTVCFAAVSSSGSKSSSGSRSSFSAPASGGSSSKAASPGNGGASYKPSAPANSFGDKAPAKQSAPGVQQNTQAQPSTGGFWRNASMIGGGFLAGSLLGNLFGFGHMGGGMSEIFGMLINLLIIGAIVMLARNLWEKYKSRDKDRYR
jgi:predicted lipid-binding transport protein (Tim44 family)